MANKEKENLKIYKTQTGKNGRVGKNFTKDFKSWLEAKENGDIENEIQDMQKAIEVVKEQEVQEIHQEVEEEIKEIGEEEVEEASKKAKKEKEPSFCLICGTELGRKGKYCVDCKSLGQKFRKMRRKDEDFVERPIEDYITYLKANNPDFPELEKAEEVEEEEEAEIEEETQE